MMPQRKQPCNTHDNNIDYKYMFQSRDWVAAPAQTTVRTPEACPQPYTIDIIKDSKLPSVLICEYAPAQMTLRTPEILPSAIVSVASTTPSQQKNLFGRYIGLFQTGDY
jgi:hypothetical protein